MRETSQQLAGNFTVAERAADEDQMRVILRVNRVPIHAPFERRCERDIDRMTRLAQPVANEVAGHDVAGGSAVKFVTEPSCDQGFHIITSEVARRLVELSASSMSCGKIMRASKY